MTRAPDPSRTPATEAELRELISLLRATLESTADGILVVDREDEEGLRALNRRVLEAHGYVVLAAASAEEALRMADGGSPPIDILVTDVIMRGASGRQLARRLLESRPDLKVLYVSGYVEGVTSGEGGLEAGAHFLQKPFTPDVLTSKVREILDGP